MNVPMFPAPKWTAFLARCPFVLPFVCPFMVAAAVEGCLDEECDVW